jgi:tetratricopeptide (TPR) repeat protein
VSQIDHHRSRVRLALLAAAAAFALTLAAGSSGALAIGMEPRTDTVTPPSNAQTQGDTTTKKKHRKSAKKTEKSSELEWINHFWAAHALIQKGEYQAGIVAMHALGSDDHPDVATYLGYASRKLGRYDEAKHWYDKALAADPNHTRTWAYYGMWHLEQGNRLKAEDYLEKIGNICGDTRCREYKMLKAALDGNLAY